MNQARSTNLLATQWQNYSAVHHDRTNLMLHVCTVPLFMAGSLALPLAVVGPVWLAGVGLFAMLAAVGAQGRGHRRERGVPAPFRSPLEAVARLFLEQWVTFPRFVLSGGFARALRS